ncbi:MAG TPA: surface-adhesin E family protein [Longimicrobiaceae bacterium]|nr:surface-adhesin E family protein [Longimicrobiaceae bacterium]
MPSRAERGALLAAQSLLLLLLTGRPASAQSARTVQRPLDPSAEWALVERIDFGAIYLDTAQVVPLDDGVYQIRTRWSFSHPQRDPGGESYDSSIALRAIDCSGQRMAILGFVELKGARPVGSMDRPLFAATWEQIDADTVVGHIARATCDLAQNRIRVAERMATGG